MHLYLNKMSIAWLILALIVAPLQAMTLPAAAISGDDCHMMQTAQPHTAQQHQAGKQLADKCDQCNGQCCDADQCNDYNCFFPHFQFSLPGSGFDVHLESPVSVHRDFTQNTTSHAPNPPFRPPV